MSGLIEFCVELRSTSEAAAVSEEDGVAPSPQTEERGGGEGGRRGGRRGKLRRQSSVVCSRVNSLSTIDYVDNGESSSQLLAQLRHLFGHWFLFVR